MYTRRCIHTYTHTHCDTQGQRPRDVRDWGLSAETKATQLEMYWRLFVEQLDGTLTKLKIRHVPTLALQWHEYVVTENQILQKGMPRRCSHESHHPIICVIAQHLLWRQSNKYPSISSPAGLEKKSRNTIRNTPKKLSVVFPPSCLFVLI